MNARIIIVHVCFRQDLNEQRPAACRCKKRITQRTAEFMVDSGVAQYVLDYTHLYPCIECGMSAIVKCSACGDTGRNKINPAVPCKVCAKEIFKQNPCKRCGGTGLVPTPNKYNIVMSVIAPKTPRVMTIEKANIERAYNVGHVETQDEDEVARIEAWDEMTQDVRRSVIVTYWPDVYDPFEGKPVVSPVTGEIIREKYLEEKREKNPQGVRLWRDSMFLLDEYGKV